MRKAVVNIGGRSTTIPNHYNISGLGSLEFISARLIDYFLFIIAIPGRSDVQKSSHRKFVNRCEQHEKDHKIVNSKTLQYEKKLYHGQFFWCAVLFLFMQ